MNRIEAFMGLASDPWYSRVWKMLSMGQTQIAEGFLRRNAGLDHLEFEHAVSRMYLDNPDRPKNYAVIQDLLLAANTKALGRKR